MRRPRPLLTLMAFALTMAASASACNFREDKVDENDPANLPVIDDSELYFTNVKDKVLTPYCLSCHSAAGGNQGGINLETHAAVMAELATIADVVFVERSMPPSGSFPVQPYALLKAWIDKGGPETAPSTGG